MERGGGDKLAADSDDETRLEKAEKAAERKAGLKRCRKQQPGAEGCCSNPDTIPRHLSVWRLLCSLIIPPFFPTDCRWSGSECPLSRRVCCATCVCGSLLCLWGDGAPSDVLPQDTDTREEVVSFCLCGEYRELCCRNIVGVEEGSVVDSGSGDVNTASKAGDKGGKPQNPFPL